MMMVAGPHILATVRARSLHVPNTPERGPCHGARLCAPGATGRASGSSCRWRTHLLCATAYFETGKADVPDLGEGYMQESFLSLPDVLEWIEALGADVRS